MKNRSSNKKGRNSGGGIPRFQDLLRRVMTLNFIECMHSASGKIIRNLAIVGLVILASVLDVRSHPLAVTTCEVHLHEDKIRTKMNILVADLVIFQGLKPKENGRYYDYGETIEASKKHVDFILDYFYIRDSKGRLLKGEHVETDISSIEGKKDTGVRPIEVMRYGIDYIFDFELEEEPSYLNFSQIFGGEDNPQPETLELQVYRDGILIDTPVKIGPKVPHIVEVDWSRPPEPLPNDWITRKLMAEKALLESLGMPQFSGVYSHLYIEDTEVRHEVIMPLVIFETFVSISKEDPDYVEVAEQVEARKNIERYFENKNPVWIDGQPVRARIDRVDFFPLETRDFMSATIPKRVSSYNTRIGIISSYKADRTPSMIRFQWDGFNRLLPYLKVNLYEFDKEPDYKYLVDGENVITWERKGSEIRVSDEGIRADFHIRADLMNHLFEADERVPGRVICENTAEVKSKWETLFTKNIKAKLNGLDSDVQIEEVRFFDLDYQEAPPGTFSGAIDLSEILVVTGFRPAGKEDKPIEKFTLEWDGLGKLNSGVLTRLIFRDRDGIETPVVFQDGEYAVSWSSGLGVGPGSLFSLPTPPEVTMISAPKYPVLAGLAILTFIWSVWQWARVKFRPGGSQITSGLVAGGMIVATLVTGFHDVPSPAGGGVEISEADKKRVFEALHQNIYQSFRLPTEERRYDALARGVDGEFLKEMYLEIQKSLIEQSSGGAVARVDSVQVTESKPQSASDKSTIGYGMNASWKVAGTVEHWGHIHTRTNLYQADFEIRAVTNSWKISEYTLLGQEQVGEPYIGLRSTR